MSDRRRRDDLRQVYLVRKTGEDYGILGQSILKSKIDCKLGRGMKMSRLLENNYGKHKDSITG